MPSNKILKLKTVAIFQTKHSLFQELHRNQGLMWLHTQEKTKIHKQLNLRYKEYFESIIATGLLKEPMLFSSVKKVSTAIIRMMDNNKIQVISLIAKTPRIIVELKEPFFGSCYHESVEVSAEEVFNKMHSMLSNADNLSTVMQIHCIFVHRIYDHLETNSLKADFVSKIFPDSLFNSECRGRKEICPAKTNPTHQLGIARHSVFAGMVGVSEKKHLRAIDRFALNQMSDFVMSAEKNRLPVVCGPSGHTGSLMLGAKLYGNLNVDQLKEYALVSFAFLTAGGNHSFHEVMVVAALAGINVDSAQYDTSIPESIKTSKLYKKLCKRFPEFLDAASNSNTKGVSHVKNA